MRFKGLDLNLLSALDALLEERNVSAAGRRVFLSQSAMSGALARLREHFRDELLQPVGRRMMLTPFAESLIGPLRQTMRQIETLVAASTAFDPATSQRRFALVISDYLQRLVVPHVIGPITREAPSITLELFQVHDEPDQALNRGEVDLVITPEGFIPPPHLSEPYYEEDHVVVGWSGNPAFEGPLTKEAFYALRHVVVRFNQTTKSSFAERELERLGSDRPIAAIAHSFSAVPLLLVETNHIAIMHRRLAQIVARGLPLVISESPVPIPKLRQMMMFHPIRSQDAGLAWLRDHLRSALVKADAAIADGDWSTVWRSSHGTSS